MAARRTIAVNVIVGWVAARSLLGFVTTVALEARKTTAVNVIIGWEVTRSRPTSATTAASAARRTIAASVANGPHDLYIICLDIIWLNITEY